MLIEKKVYELPTEDTHLLKIVEVGELKKIQTKFGVKDKFTIKIEVLDQKAEEGDETIYVFMTVAPSVGDKAQLGKFARKLGFNTASGSFETDDLLGMKFTSHITHDTGSNGNTYANVVIDTVKKYGPATKATAAAPKPLADEDIPF
jgi:hypothetical protein